MLMDSNKFYQLLKNHIKKCGYTQKELAEELGITQPQVNNIIMCRERLGYSHPQAWGADLHLLG